MRQKLIAYEWSWHENTKVNAFLETIQHFQTGLFIDLVSLRETSKLDRSKHRLNKAVLLCEEKDGWNKRKELRNIECFYGILYKS